MRPLLPLAFVLAFACTGSDGTDNPDDGATDTGGDDTPTVTTGDTGQDTPTDGNGDSGDRDRDGLSDAEEAALGTDPDNVDTDRDGASDGLEVNGLRTDPLDPDTDADGLNDGDEVDLESDPLDDDTDDDGVLDGAELDQGTSPLIVDSDYDGLDDGGEGKCDPANWDSDGDGLPDGLEVLNSMTDCRSPDTDGEGLTDFDEFFIYQTDPNKADTDDDGLTDAEELLEGSNPNKADTDGDQLSDFDEVRTHKTDPANPDTDGGGAFDGVEVLTDITDPLDPSDDICSYVFDVAVDDPSFVPKGPDFDPQFLSVRLAVLNTDDGLQDYWLDENFDGLIDTEEEFSSSIAVDLYGPELDYLCTVEFEADNATRTDDPTLIDWAAGADLYETFEFAKGAVGATDCASLDKSIYDFTDMRKVIDALDLGVAFGAIDEVEDVLKVLAGDDWRSDWEPFVYGGYVTFDGVDAFPINYGFTYDAVCDRITLDGGGDPMPLGSVTAAPLPEKALRVSEPIFLVPFIEATGIECARAELDISDEDFTPESDLMDADSLRFYYDGVPLPEGGLSDYYDEDGNAQSAQLIIEFYENSTQTIDCKLVYDASAAVEYADPTSVLALDVTGASVSAPLMRAWSLKPQDGSAEGDCGTLDTTLGWSEADPEVLVEGLNFGFAVNVIHSDLDSRGAATVTDYVNRSPDLLSGYSSIFEDDVENPAFFEVSFIEPVDTDDCFVEDPDGDLVDDAVIRGGGSARLKPLGWPTTIRYAPL